MSFSKLNSALYLATSNICDFCHQPGHSRLDCEAISIGQKTMKRRRRQRKRQNNHTKQLDIHSVTEFAGNAALSDHMALNSPLQLDAKFNWIANTGATSHMTSHRHWIQNYSPLTVPVRLADNTIVYSAGVGTVVLNCKGNLPKWSREQSKPDNVESKVNINSLR
jgi:hypothetical protein